MPVARWTRFHTFGLLIVYLLAPVRAAEARLTADEVYRLVQTVYAREPGSVAAPTAGLHFDEALLARLRGRFTESVIQDVDIPLARAGEFLDFLLREIGIVPVWVCPIRPADAAARFTLCLLYTSDAADE